MASLDAILCSEPHAAPLTYEPARQDVLVPERDAAPDEKMTLGKPPFSLSGSRRKSGWGKRFKEREQGRLAIIFPRRKMGEASRGSDAVWLSVEVLNSLADRSLASAAKLLVSTHPLDMCSGELSLLRMCTAWRKEAGQVKHNSTLAATHFRLFLSSLTWCLCHNLRAAVLLQGISSTALKKACRELGVERWPYCRKRQAEGGAASADGDSASRAETARGSSSPEPSVPSNGAPSPAGPRCSSISNGEEQLPSHLLDLLHRNAVMVLEAAKRLEGGPGRA
jgi:hypothetical protein